MTDPIDPQALNRFVDAQESYFTQALAEISAGQKRSHWMWFIFPQFAGLGSSATAQQFAIRSRGEAATYLAHPVLGPRLIACAKAALAIQGRTAREVFGTPDDLKLRSCATLFAQIALEGSVFEQLLERYFDGQPDARTLTLLAHADRLL
ncbi:MAG: DUF1810 domain-containing protein [Lamprobacter sp.]|uniref:DUF1810 domain-containing protein n=1 Tax=Lamprobacter sp. TaxID=3100796 RepID=UPI002B258277|nr:DUF1810 domain-containing protein [Lamprobacter sp.]MEA3642420.1 DUF1810 domain-containing protein [Lamprobacter sp.]